MTETTDPSYRHLAEAEEAAAALAAGRLTFTFDGSQPSPEAPPPGAPVSVVRPVRLAYEVDAAVKAIAEARGMTVSALIREWVQSGLAAAARTSDTMSDTVSDTAGDTAAGTVKDAVTELRQGLNHALRALDSLTARGIRPAA